mgnify:CR=1 FL=1
MPQESHQSAPGDDAVDAIIAEYFEAIERGEVPDRAKLIEAHPEHAEELRAFFADHVQFARSAAPLGAQNSLPPGASRAQMISGMKTAPADPNAETTDGILHDAPDPMPGEFVRYFGDYELTQEIARGGMGVVYEARQISLGRTVALKMILAGQLAGEPEVKRFQQEAESAANLDHPHIVPIYEVGQYKGRHYFTMKLIDGGPLSEHLARLKGDLRATASLMIKVARAVHFAHQRGILHRDLKPANVLLDVNDEPHVTDFGLAKRVDAEGSMSVTHPGGVLGTPAYMPPEQARGQKNLTTAADVYSLGAILYVLLTGQPPFRAATPLDTMRKLIDEDPASPRSISSHVPHDLETICLKCLEKDPARRYASADELAKELQRWLNHEPIEARRVNVVGRVARWTRRNPKLAAAYSIAASIIITLSCVYYIRLITEKAHTATALKGEMSARLEAESQRDQAQDALSRGKYEQARSLLLSRQSGRRWKALELLDESNQLRTRQTKRRVTVHSGSETFSADVPVKDRQTTLPDEAELRTQAVAALLTPDGRELHRLTSSFGMPPSITDDGRYAACFWTDMNLALMARSPAGAGDLMKESRSGLRILDTTSGKQIAQFDVPPLATYAMIGMAIDPKARWYVGQQDNHHVLRSLVDGKVVRQLEDSLHATPGQPFQSFTFLPDGVTVAAVRAGAQDSSGAATTGKVLFWELQTGELQDHRTIELGEVSSPVSMYASPSGKYLMVRINEKQVRVISLAGGRAIDVSLPAIERDTTPLTVGGETMVMDPLDQYMAIQCTARLSRDSYVLVWNLAENREQYRVGEHRWFPITTPTMAFSPDGSQLALGSYFGDVVIYDSDTGREQWRLHNAHELVAAVRWAPDGNHLVTAGIEGGIKRWELAPRPCVRDLPEALDTGRPIFAQAVSADGRWLAVSMAGSPRTRVIDVSRGRLARMVDHDGYPCCSPDGTQLAVVRVSEPPSIVVIDVETGRKKFESQRALPAGLAGRSDLIENGSMGFNDQGHFCLLSLREGRAEVYDVQTGQTRQDVRYDPSRAPFTHLPATALYHARPMESEAVEFGGSWEFTDLTRSAKPVKLTSSDDRLLMNQGVISGDGKWVARLYINAAFMGQGDEDTGFRTGVLLYGLDADGKTIDLFAREPMTGAMFSPDGKWLAVAHRRGGVGIFAMPSGKELFRVPAGHMDDARLLFDATASRLLVTDGEQFYRVVDLKQLKEELGRYDLAW